MVSVKYRLLLARCFLFAGATFLAVLLLPANVHAYGDPGTGALIMQMLLAAFLGAMFYFRKFIARITGKRKGKSSDRKVEGDGEV